MCWSGPDKRQVLSWLAKRWPLLLVVGLSLVTRMPLVLAKLGGFHAYNEGFYALGAVSQSHGSVFETLLNPVDLNNMPVFSWILTGIVATLGRAEWAIRLPSLISSLAAVYMAGVLAERLIHPKAAVYAGAFVAITPAFVIVGTNAQPDMLMVGLGLGGMLAYVEAYRVAKPATSAEQPDGGETGDPAPAGQPGRSRGEARLRALSGVLFGLSILAKLNGVLAPVSVAAWETTRRQSARWALRPSARLWLATWIGLPAAWVILQTVLRGSQLLSSQEGLARTFRVPDMDFLLRLPSEVFFQLGPAIAVAGLSGAVMAAVRRERGQALLLWIVAISLGFFAFYHFHSYYLLLGVVAFSMLAALPVASLRPTWARWMALAAVLAIAVPFTWMSYQHKVSAPGIALASEWMTERAQGPIQVVLPKLAADNSAQVFQYYLPDAELTRSWAEGPSGEPTDTFVVFYFADPSWLPEDSWVHMPQQVTYPVILGRALSFRGDSIHWFSKQDIDWVPVGPIWWFGEYRGPSPDLRAVDVQALSDEEASRFREDWHSREILSEEP